MANGRTSAASAAADRFLASLESDEETARERYEKRQRAHAEYLLRRLQQALRDLDEYDLAKTWARSDDGVIVFEILEAREVNTIIELLERVSGH